MNIVWGEVAGGLGTVIVCFLLFRFRVAYSRFTGTQQHTMYGKRGDQVARSNTPRMVAVVAVGGMAIGVLMMIQGFVHH